MSYKLAHAHTSEIVKPLPWDQEQYRPSFLSKAPSAAELTNYTSRPTQVGSASTISFPFRYHKDFDLVHEDYWTNRNKYFSPLYEQVNRFNDDYYLNKARPYWTKYRSDLYEYSHPYYRTRYQGTTYEPYFKTSYYSPYRANVYNRMSISFNKALAAYRSGLTDFSTLNHGHITRNYLDKQGCDWRRLYEPKTERLHYHQPHLYRNRQFLTAWT